jgi:tetratricopeptide (TPR) repeat protein
LPPTHLYQIEKQVNELATLISTGGTGPVICSCRSEEEIESVKRMLRKVAKETFRVYNISYTNNEDLIERFRKNQLDQNTVIFVNGLGKILDENPVRKLELYDFLVRSNMITILWIKQEHLSQLIADAPYSWVINSRIVKFYAEQDLGKPIVFMSYINDDSDFVFNLYHRLLDHELIVSTYETDLILNNIDNQVFKNTSNTLIFMPILSRQYSESKFCREKLNEVLAKFESYSYTRIVPVRIENALIPSALAQYKWIDLGKSKDDFNILLSELGGSELKTNYSPANPLKKGEGLKQVDITHPNQSTIKTFEKSVALPAEKIAFVGREQDVSVITKLLEESNDPVSIVGRAKIGKSALAFEIMQRCEYIFSNIIPVYIEATSTVNDFFLSIAENLNIHVPKHEFQKLHSVKDHLNRNLSNLRHPLLFIDNFDRISAPLKNEGELEDLVQIKDFLENIPSNTSILLTSRVEPKLKRERIVELNGLTKKEGKELFIEMTKNYFPEKVPEDIQTLLEEISSKLGGDPLSIQDLARSYRGGGLEEIRVMLGKLDTKSHEDYFKYSAKNLDRKDKELLDKLILFNSPFPISAITSIFDVKKIHVLKLYDHKFLTSIDSDKYGILEQDYWLYQLHPALRSLKKMSDVQRLELDYGEKFSQYYLDLIRTTYNALNDGSQSSSLRRFNIIMAEEDNDIVRSIRVTKNPTLSADISSKLGLLMYRKGMFGKALHFHEYALAKHQEQSGRLGMAGDYENIGNILRSQGNYEQALSYHNKALEIHQELGDRLGMAGDYNSMGVILYSQGNYEQALSYHNKALDIHQELGDRLGMAGDYENIGIILREKGNFDEALESHHKALELDRETKDTEEMGTKNATRQYSVSRLSRKVDELLNVLEVDQGTDINALNNKGLHLFYQSKQYEAIKYFDRSLEIDPRSTSSWLNKGYALYSLGSYSEAIKCFDKAIELDPDFADAWHNKGLALGNLGKHYESTPCLKKAIECYDKFIDKNANDVNALNGKGVALDDLKRYDEAIKCFDKAIELDPGFSYPWHNKGYSLGNLRKYNEAIKCFDKAIELDPDFVDTWRNKGFALCNIGDYDEAIKCFDKAIEIDPDFSYAWNSKGYAFLAFFRRNADEAIKCFDKAIELDPGFSYAWYNKGCALNSLVKYDEAIKCFDKAIELDPELEYSHIIKAKSTSSSIAGLASRILLSLILKKMRTKGEKLSGSMEMLGLIMPLKYPLQSFTMPLKYPLQYGRMPMGIPNMPLKYVMYPGMYFDRIKQ